MSNPFDINNLGSMMQGLQQNMMRIKAEAEAAEVEGSAGGGLVTVVATGGQKVLSVRISPSAMDDREMLEDLIVAATNNALTKGKELMAQKLSALTGGLPLPPGLL
ncbi:YbaB/EbfC family nucleoid-associated protein [Myxococcota bacterium]|nr:YbaB/EbfC family nucleoid-associated protein [Myxococcota bacterium]